MCTCLLLFAVAAFVLYVCVCMYVCVCVCIYIYIYICKLVVIIIRTISSIIISRIMAVCRRFLLLFACVDFFCQPGGRAALGSLAWRSRSTL